MNETWNTSHDETITTTTTRLSYAKRLIEDIVGNLIINSNRYQVGIITSSTSSSINTPLSEKEDDENSPSKHQGHNDTTTTTTSNNKIEFLRPSIALIHQIQQLSSSTKDDNFWNGLVHATNHIVSSLVCNSKNKWSNRASSLAGKCSVVLLTDAQHPISSFHFSSTMIKKVIQSFQSKWTLLIVGLQFNERKNQHTKRNTIQRENFKFISSLIPHLSTKSHIIPIDNHHEDEKRKKLQMIRRSLFNTHSLLRKQSTKTKIILDIAPNLYIQAISCLYVTKTNVPTLKREVIMLEDNDTQKVKKDGAGEMMTSAIKTSTTYWEGDEEVSLKQRTEAFRYGSDFIPMGTFDIHGLTYTRRPIHNKTDFEMSSSCGSIQILGYTPQSKIPKWSFIGPSRIIFANPKDTDYRRACVAISSLAKALNQLQQYAICSSVQKENADPIMGILFPRANQIQQRYLFFLQLPFANDVILQNLSTNIISPSQKIFFANNNTIATGNKRSKQLQEEKCCDDLIDTLFIQNDEKNDDIGLNNPSIQSFYDTVQYRALNPSSQENSIINPPSKMSDINYQKATAQLNAFRDTFPLEKVEYSNTTTSSKSTKKRKFWSSSV